MPDITQLLTQLGFAPDTAMKFTGYWLTALLIVRMLRSPITRAITWCVDRFDDISSKGRSQGEALLIIVDSRIYRVLFTLVDFLFRIHLPTRATLEERWRKMDNEAFLKEVKAGAIPDAGSRMPDAEAVDGRKITGIGAFAALLATSLVCFTACKNPELAAYRTIGGVAATVDTAMTAWGDWVRAGRATPADEVRVKAAYVKYQAAMKVAEQSVKTARKIPPGTASYAAIVSMLSESADPLVALIDTFVPHRPR